MSPRLAPAVPTAMTAAVIAAAVSVAVACSAPLAAAPPAAPSNAPAPAARPTATTPAPRLRVAGQTAAGTPATPRPASTTSAAPKPAAPKPTAPNAAVPKPAARPTPKKAIARAPAPPPPEGLKPGQFRWLPELSPDGPVVVVVSLPDQLVHVYRNGIRIGVSTISSGMPGYETITGTFPILERHTEHYSNLYDNAPMPYMLRLTWSGTALHAGHLPGRPASHGCVRLPKAFAAVLFDTVRRGTVVVIADAASHPPQIVRPGWVTPVDPATGAPVRAIENAAVEGAAVEGAAVEGAAVEGAAVEGAAIEATAVESAKTERWMPERAPEGPLGLLLSTPDGLLVVLRNGVEIGRAPATVSGTPAPGSRLYALHVIGATPPPEVVAPANPQTEPAEGATGTASPGTTASAPAQTPGTLPAVADVPTASPAMPTPLVAPPAVGPPPPPELHWQALAMPGRASAPGTLPLRGGALLVSDTFARRLQAVLPADARLVITDEPLRPTAPTTETPPARGDATPVTPATPTPAQLPTPAR